MQYWIYYYPETRVSILETESCNGVRTSLYSFLCLSYTFFHFYLHILYHPFAVSISGIRLSRHTYCDMHSSMGGWYSHVLYEISKNWCRCQVMPLADKTLLAFPFHFYLSVKCTRDTYLSFSLTPYSVLRVVGKKVRHLSNCAEGESNRTTWLALWERKNIGIFRFSFS